MVFWIRVTKAKVLGSGWIYILLRKQDLPIHSGRVEGKSLRINTSFHSCPRHPVFLANLQAWFRSPSDVYPHIMCFGIPCFIICISTVQSFPQGSMYVWLCVTHCQAYGALSTNTVIMMNDGILDDLEFISSVMVNFSVLRGPMTPCLFPVLPDGATSSSACCEHILVVKN